jgi:MFS family permease
MSASDPEPVPAEITDSNARSSFPALRHRDFRLLWLGQIVSVTGSQMQLVAINWHVYLLTKSAFALGLVGLFRGAPIIICSLVGGVVADVVNRKRLMVATQTTMLATAGLLALLTAVGLTNVWPIYLLTAIGAAATAFDIPARQALMPRLVPAKDFSNAVSLSMLVFQIGMVVGPAVAGLVLAHYTPAVVYGANALSYVAVIIALLLMRTSGEVPRAADDAATRVSVSALKEGLRFVWRTPIIVQTMTLDFVATFFASATALLPIFADGILHVGAQGLGILAAAPALGAIVAGVAMARLGTPRHQGAIVIGSVAVFGAATVGFGLSRIFWVSLLMLAIIGAADTVSTILRQTIRQLATPDQLRGRMTSINMMFFMGGPQLGELEAGALAALVGAQLSVVTGGIGCLVAVVIAMFACRTLLNYREGAQGNDTA